jgi:hypothetical protein
MLTLLAAAAVSAPMTTWQARLLDADGAPLSGPVALELGLYAAVSGGSPLWEDDFSVTASDGFVSAELGSGVALPQNLFANGETRWMQVRANGTILSRQPFHAVAWADTSRRTFGVVERPETLPCARGELNLSPEGDLRVCDGSAWRGVTSTRPARWSSATEAAAAGLTAYWLFDGTTAEYDGFGGRTLTNNGAVYNGSESPFTALAAAVKPQVIDLDGNNDYLTYAGRLLSSNQYTVLMWVYMDAGNPSTRSYLYDGRNTGGWYYLFDGTDDLTFHPCGTELATAQTYDIQGKWTLHVLRGNGTTAYIDIFGGASPFSFSAAASCTVDDRNVYLGTYYGAGGSSGQYFFNGKFAEFAVFNGTFLSNATIAEIYDARVPLLP